ncbi:MAG: hypothetical protein ACYDH1_15940 [Anaerolineaceae bacterium]
MVGELVGQHPGRINPGDRPGKDQPREPTWNRPTDSWRLSDIGWGTGWPTSRKNQPRGSTRNRPTDSWRLSDIGWGIGWPTSRKDQLREPTRNRPTQGINHKNKLL